MNYPLINGPFTAIHVKIIFICMKLITAKYF